MSSLPCDQLLLQIQNFISQVTLDKNKQLSIYQSVIIIMLDHHSVNLILNCATKWTQFYHLIVLYFLILNLCHCWLFIACV